MAHSFPVRLLINTIHGPVPLTPERSVILLPRGPGETSPPLQYGAYLASVASFLARDDHSPLKEALSAHQQRPVPLEEIQALEVISSKHGACYQVLRLRAILSSGICSLAVNVAMTETQRDTMEREFHIVRKLQGLSPRAFLPRFHLMDEAVCRSAEGNPLPLRLFIAEWLDGHHEFHLSGPQDERVPRIKLWESDQEGRFLSDGETRSLYRQASFILTTYLDGDSFRQIHPWHHAAGDFVVRRDAPGIAVRLVTARDYRSLSPPGPGPDPPWVPILHFLFSLSVRMRLDRLDGTGPLAWAPAGSLSGVVNGFVEAWREKTFVNPALPAVEAVLELARRLSLEEWTSFGECVMEDCLVELAEAPFVRERLSEHLVSLTEAIREALTHIQ